MKLVIKNMVSLRCILWVKSELERLHISYTEVQLGEVTLPDPISISLYDQLEEALQKGGLEIIEDRKKILVERIKHVIIDVIHNMKELPKENYSYYISQKLEQSYTQLANVFSELEHITIEHFIIAHKIEKVKELLSYDDLSLVEIADKLHYSSAAHLSAQFKKVTGVTPSRFKGFQPMRRKTIESL